MSGFFNLYTFDVSKLLVEHSKQIDDNDDDFRYILDCLGQIHENNINVHCFDDSKRTIKRCDKIESRYNIKKVIEHQTYSQNGYTSNQVYPGYSQISEEALANEFSTCMKGRSQEKFPTKLFKILELSDASGYSSIISWLPHGRAFKIHDQKLFKEHIMKKYFFQTKFESFKRQLYVYGFKIIGKRFADSGAYYHESFLRGKLNLCRQIPRWNGKESRSTRHTPSFYKMPEIKPDINNCNSDESIVENERITEPQMVQYVVLDV